LFSLRNHIFCLWLYFLKLAGRLRNHFFDIFKI
jgi:hypothetical protein